MIFFLFFLPLLSISGVVKDEVSVTEKTTFSFRTVCEKMVPFETPLIEIVSGSEIDCMGKNIKVGEFCEKELATDPYYLRGYVDKENKQVTCVSGKKMIFKYQCVKLSDRELCSKEAKSACFIIQEKLAKRLDMVHFSFTKNDKGIKELNCYFDSLPLKKKLDGSL